jgi:hypothetical protein
MGIVSSSESDPEQTLDVLAASSVWSRGTAAGAVMLPSPSKPRNCAHDREHPRRKDRF